MKKADNKPSRVALALFHWYCRPELREEIEGDLLERFNTNCETHGKTRANRQFIKDVVLLFRPRIIGNIYHLTNTETMIITKYKRLIMIMAVAASLLLVPLVAMFFTSEVDWKILDFLVAAILLCGAGAGLEFILRKIKTRRNRILLVTSLFLILVLVWAELAVGIFGTIVSGS